MAVQCRVVDGSLDITIDYRQVKKDNIVLWLMHIWAIFWIGGLVWLGLTLVMRDGSWLGGFALAIAALSLYPYCGTLLSRSWAESICITTDTITFSRLGILTPKPIVLPLSAVSYIALGAVRSWHNHAGEPGETMITLGVYSGGQRRFIIGYWLLYNDKRAVFDAIETFIATTTWPGKMVLHDAEFHVTWDQQGRLTGATRPAQEV
jgi:hypothetical protein